MLPPVEPEEELELLELLLVDDEDDEDEGLEPEHSSALTLAPEMVIESTLAIPSAELPDRTRRLEPPFSDNSTVSSAQFGHPPVVSKLNGIALPSSPLAVKVPGRAVPAPLA